MPPKYGEGLLANDTTPLLERSLACTRPSYACGLHNYGDAVSTLLYKRFERKRKDQGRSEPECGAVEQETAASDIPPNCAARSSTCAARFGRDLYSGNQFLPRSNEKQCHKPAQGSGKQNKSDAKKGKTADKPENSEQYVKRGLTATAYARKSQVMLTAFTLERSIPSLQAGWSLGLHFGWIHQEWSGLLDLAEGKGRLANKLKRPSPKSGGCNFTVLKNDL